MLSLGSLGDEAAYANHKVLGRTDRDRALYAPGETMSFTISIQDGDAAIEGNLAWKRSGDDGKVEEGRARVTPAAPLVVTTSLDKPGFVWVQAALVDDEGKPLRKPASQPWQGLIEFHGGAGVEIEKLQGVPEPAGFDAFWEQQKAKLAAVPITPVLVPQPSDNPKVEIFAVTVPCAGPQPVTGYLTVPAGAAAKSLPAMVGFQGYSTSLQQAPKNGNESMISLTINAHGYELGREPAYYEDFVKRISTGGRSYAFNPEENADPETAYFNGMMLRVLRAVQFVKTLPQWDGKKLSVSGGSQGGLQAITAAAQDADVTNCSADVPWCCDLGGVTLGRVTGGWRLAYVPALDFYDPIHHAKRIRCPVVIPRAGLGDYTCPPSGVTVFYNNVTTKKKITYVQGSTHGHVPTNAQRFTLEGN
jgi:cephalosporin-C deacetylase-like acetyl esterase